MAGMDDMPAHHPGDRPAGLDEMLRGPLPGDFRSGFASLVGRANVGKSTLINRLVGQKIAIVSHVPQTTRNRILGVRTLPHGQVAFLDSPGFHKPQHQMGFMMLETARQVAGEAEVLLLVIDASAGFGPGDRFVLDELKNTIGERPLVAVLNKVDGVNKGKLLPLIEQAVGEWGAVEAVPVSGLTGENCDRLLDVVLRHLPQGPALFPDDFVTDQDERRFIAEVIREKLLSGLRQEVPHSVAVVVERMENREDGIAEIHAAILVERETQKAIVIGRQGVRLKDVGTAARKELEKRVGKQVFLKLWVKVREDWRDKVGILRDIGILPG
jgi:GTP-binding protein Era